nr:RNA-dependent RNA polymerase [Hubei picorna-like virus 80]
MDPTPHKMSFAKTPLGSALTQKQKNISDFGKFYPMLYSRLTPHFGPRFLNNICYNHDYMNVRVHHKHMRDYYSFLKGSMMTVLGMPRDVNLEVGDIMDFVSVLYDLEKCKDYDFQFNKFENHQIGYVEHLPYKNWCFKISDDMYVIRNELDCVGYTGTNRLKVTQGHKKSRFIDECIRAQNILPSLFVRKYWKRHLVDPDRWYRHKGESNFIWIGGYKFDIYIHISDYDAWSLSRKTHMFYGLDYCVGRTGHVFKPRFTHEFKINQMDGYRFWYELYNIDELWMKSRCIDIDHYFAGSAFRQQRRRLRRERELEGVDLDCSELFSCLELQGGTFSSLSHLVESVNEIGILARTANGAKSRIDDFAQRPWVQELIRYITSISQNIAHIVQDFYEFQKDPLGFITNIFKGAYTDFNFFHSAGEERSLTDIMSHALLMSLARYVFKNNQIVSVGLTMYSLYNLFSNFYEKKRYARAAALVSTFVYIGVMKATQLKPASIELQGGNNNLTSMIYAMSAFVTLGFAGKGISTSHSDIIKHLFTKTKDLFSIARGTLAVSKCIEYVVETLQIACEYVFGSSFAYKTLIKMTVSSSDLREYIEYCLITQPEDLAVKLTLDFDSRRQWERICILHKDLIKVFASGKPPTETHIGYSMYVRASSSFVKLRQEYDKIKNSLDHFRPEPFMVWIWGEPGTGKTWCRDKFVNNMYRWHSSIDPTLPDVRKTGLLYVRNPADKFMSKYNGEFALGYDDVGQNRQTDNPEFNEIMGFGSTNQVRLNMADLEDKGRLFSSKVVIMASNSKNVVANNLILKEDAFNRRRHIVVEMKRPLTKTDGLATSKCDFTQVALILTDPITGELVKRFPENGFGEDNATFLELFAWLAPKYVKHVEDQIKGLEQKEKALQCVLNGEEDLSIFDIPQKIADELPKLDPLLDTTLSKFRRIARLYEYDETFQCVVEGIKNCVSAEYTEPTALLKTEFDSSCEEYGIEKLTDKEWKFLYTQAEKLTPEDIQSIDEIWKQQTESMSSKFPWIGFLKTIGLVASGFAVYKLASNFFSEKSAPFDLQGFTDNKPFSDPQSLVEIQKYNLEPKCPPKQRVEIQKYNMEPLASKANKVVIQNQEMFIQLEDKIGNIETVSANFSKSMARFAKVTQNETFYLVNGFNVCYNIWMLPRHFFGKEIDDVVVQVERPLRPTEYVTILKKNIYSYQKYDMDGCLQDKDICFVRIPQFEHGRNHIKHFASDRQLTTCRNFQGKLIRWSAAKKTTEDVVVGETQRWDVPQKITHDGVTLHYSNGYQYNFDTTLGDCGAILMSIDKTTSCRIFGIHFALDKINHRGMSVNIPRQDIEMIVHQMTPVVDQINAVDPIVELQYAECPPTLINQETGLPYFEHLGYVKDGPLPPRDHGELHRSPLFDDVYPAEKDLSVLNKFDERMDEEFRGDPDILTRGVVDFSYESLEWPHAELEIAKHALKGEFDKFTDPLGKRLLNKDEAINGVWVEGGRLDFSEPLNLKTSAGYGLHGTKQDHFDTKEIFDDNNQLIKVEHTIKTPALEHQVSEMWRAWMDGETYSIPWSHTVKIEPLKMSKIKNGNTRTFCVASTAFLINVRRLFGSFTTAMKASKIKSFSCLGTDANSQDWNDLYNNLISTGKRGADMDFFKFDRTAVTHQLARAVCEMINAWYDDGDNLARARLIAFEEMIFAYCLVNKHLTRKRRGNPSGNPLTTELNNCVNYLMLCMVYLLIAKEKKPESYSIKDWNRLVNMKAYGDDIIFTLHPEAESWFSFSLLEHYYRRHGVPVTPADKSDDGIQLRSLHDLTFLKRNFRRFDHPYIKWQSALSQTSIKSMIQFYRLKPNNGTMMEAVITNCTESLHEAYHWGREFFESHRDKINNWMKENGHMPIAITYEELDVMFRAKLDTGY